MIDAARRIANLQLKARLRAVRGHWMGPEISIPYFDLLNEIGRAEGAASITEYHRLSAWYRRRSSGFLMAALGFAVALCFPAFFIGVEMAAAMKPGTAFGSVASAQRELTPDELKEDFVYTRLERMDIELRIASPEDFALGAKSKLLVRAFAYDKLRPCRVVIPVGWEVWALPSQGRAGWVNEHDGDTVAHELLHCLRGNWHAEFTKKME